MSKLDSKIPEGPIAEKWTNTSGPLSCSMNPKPLASLNHFTVPSAILKLLHSGWEVFCCVFSSAVNNKPLNESLSEWSLPNRLPLICLLSNEIDTQTCYDALFYHSQSKKSKCLFIFHEVFLAWASVTKPVQPAGQIHPRQPL